METREVAFNGIIKLSSDIFNYFRALIESKKLNNFKNNKLNHENKSLFLHCNDDF